MAGREFVISDLHLGHANILTFKRNDGSPLRDFPDLTAFHQTLITNWNKVVGSQDKVRILGDIVINKKFAHILNELNGKKMGVMGNHDLLTLNEYKKYLYNVMGVKVLSKYGLVLTHVPVHPDCLNRPSWRINVHGHLHANRISEPKAYPCSDDNGVKGTLVFPDPKYFNVCCEEINYTPLDIEAIYEQTKHININENTIRKGT